MSYQLFRQEAAYLSGLGSDSPNPDSLVGHCLNSIQDKHPQLPDEKQLAIAQELVRICWARLLFLKQAEHQLIQWHPDQATYPFLNHSFIPNFQTLAALFFMGMSLPHEKRPSYARFPQLPFLNEHFFYLLPIEVQYLSIGELDPSCSILPMEFEASIKELDEEEIIQAKKPILQQMLQLFKRFRWEDEAGIRRMEVLQLWEDLRHDWQESELSAELLSAASRKLVRDVVLQGFQTRYQWEVEDMKQLKEKMQGIPIQAAHDLINELSICDPSLESATMLIEALEEMLMLKGELEILRDAEEKKLWGLRAIEKEGAYEWKLEKKSHHYRVDSAADGYIRSVSETRHKVQAALFREISQLVGNSSFGLGRTDWQVQMAQMQVGLLLLKYAYFTPESDFEELTLLPNLDINLKKGNALLYRFALNTDLSKLIKGTQQRRKARIQLYLSAVKNYRRAKGDFQKAEFRSIFENIQQDFQSYIKQQQPLYKRLQKLEQERYMKSNPMFELNVSADEEREQAEKSRKLDEKIAEIRATLEPPTDSPLHQEGFEWRFMVPEIMDLQTGRFKGFDILLVYPNMQRQEWVKEVKQHLRQGFQTKVKAGRVWQLYAELGMNLLSPAGQMLCTLPQNWQSERRNTAWGKWIRRWQIKQVINLPKPQSSKEALCLLFLQKSSALHAFPKAEPTQKPSNWQNYLNQQHPTVESIFISKQSPSQQGNLFG